MKPSSHAVLAAELVEYRQVLQALMEILDVITVECETDTDGARFDVAYAAARALVASTPAPKDDEKTDAR